MRTNFGTAWANPNYRAKITGWYNSKEGMACFPFLLKPIERTAGETQNWRRLRDESDSGWLKSKKLGHMKGDDSQYQMEGEESCERNISRKDANSLGSSLLTDEVIRRSFSPRERCWMLGPDSFKGSDIGPAVARLRGDSRSPKWARIHIWTNHNGPPSVPILPEFLCRSLMVCIM